ncbi:2-succinyl-6-hydroxy-2,4-cyclohexadiene-1-carboxylate synthase [Lentimonas sp. CC4]|uniref:2-succinyl-6-hydroxy-2, 4-cyclohexadiene-1-carboxylate synthase n=1 Tax=Lentimonas sp. CC4 TaxID=2676099 RepID=UPI00138A1EEC
MSQSKIKRSSASKLLNKKAQILALHGFTGCGEDFSEFSPLCGSGHAWTCPDLPGHGQDPELNCTPDATIQQLERSAASIQSDKSVASTKILLGYSMGARAALLHATTHPKHWDALILISANPGIEDETVRTDRASSDAKLAQRIRNDGVPTFLEYWQQTPIIRSQQAIRADWLATMQQHRLQHTAEGLAASLEQFGQAACPNLWPQLKQLTCPILLVTGARDKKYSAIAQRMGAETPQAKWVSIPEVGHMPHLEAPETTSAAIRDFIARL